MDKNMTSKTQNRVKLDPFGCFEGNPKKTPIWKGFDPDPKSWTKTDPKMVKNDQIWVKRGKVRKGSWDQGQNDGVLKGSGVKDPQKAQNDLKKGPKWGPKVKIWVQTAKNLSKKVKNDHYWPKPEKP